MLTTPLLCRWHGIASRVRTASPSFRLRGRGLQDHDAAASSVAPSIVHRVRVDPRRGCSAPARRGLPFWQSLFESSHSGRSRGIFFSPAGGTESFRPTDPPFFCPSSPLGLRGASVTNGAPLDLSRGPTNLRSDSFLRSFVFRFGSSQSGNKNGAQRRSFLAAPQTYVRTLL